eukprot:TRINITY_DN11270_c0_g1_i1.p1 TRINITY_DN11270_c0_g1~~TRINITY_DN11270_c0_g1_i1.p1  ORF type:complete len:225 (+),score=65.91 TRINITY_DN11270_c0_g1_i1:32-676(+)
MAFVLPKERGVCFEPELVRIDDDDIPEPVVSKAESVASSDLERAERAEQRVAELEEKLRRVSAPLAEEYARPVPPVPPARRNVRNTPAATAPQSPRTTIKVLHGELEAEKAAHQTLQKRFSYLVTDTQEKLQLIKREFDTKERENQHLRTVIQEMQDGQRKRTRSNSASSRSTPAPQTPKRRAGMRTQRMPGPGADFAFSDLPKSMLDHYMSLI